MIAQAVGKHAVRRGQWPMTGLCLLIARTQGTKSGLRMRRNPSRKRQISGQATARKSRNFSANPIFRPQPVKEDPFLQKF